MTTSSNGSGTGLKLGWPALVAWGLVGAVLTFSVVAAASIGLFVLPVALITSVTVAKRVRLRPEVAGVFEGAAAVVLCFGIVNLGSRPCPSSGSGVVRPGTPTSTTSCGGFDPLPWFTVGLVLAGAGLVAYLLARRRS